MRRVFGFCMSKSHSLSKDKVMKAQKSWADGIVKIGADYISKRDYVQTAQNHIDDLYAYDQSPVLFKPTKAAQEQFRGNKDSALSYFVATNGVCPEDKGFALQPWTKVRFENDQILIQGNTAIAMGNYFFTSDNGHEVKVEYTFGYLMDAQGKLHINLHHSSMPFTFPKTNA